MLRTAVHELGSACSIGPMVIVRIVACLELSIYANYQTPFYFRLFRDNMTSAKAPIIPETMLA